MKRLIAFASIAFIGLGLAGPSGADQPQKTSAGSGQTASGWTITYNGTEGSGDLGEFDAVSPGGTKYHGEVTCVNVSGNTATLYGFLTDGPGGDFLLSVVDNVNGKGKKSGSPDRIALEINPDEEPGCGDPAEGFTDLISGNLQVKS